MWCVSTVLSLIMSNQTVVWAFYSSPNRTLFKMWLKYSNVDFKKHLTINHTSVTMKLLLNQCKSFPVSTAALPLAYNRCKQSVLIVPWINWHRYTSGNYEKFLVNANCSKFTESEKKHVSDCVLLDKNSFLAIKSSSWHLTVYQLRQMLFSLFHRQQRLEKKTGSKKTN